MFQQILKYHHDGILKFVGTSDTDNIGTLQAGTASTALDIDGSSVTATVSNGLVKDQTLSGAGNFIMDGSQSGLIENHP